jgi:nucleotide-binding universal stress UspA family protein
MGIQSLSLIICPVTETDYSIEAVKYASYIARSIKAKILLVHVVTIMNETMKKQAEKIFNTCGDLITFHGVEYETLILEDQGKPWRPIMTVIEQKNPDLVVIGTRGRRPWSKAVLGGPFFGGTAEKIAQNAKCTVILVRKGKSQ